MVSDDELRSRLKRWLDRLDVEQLLNLERVRLSMEQDQHANAIPSGHDGWQLIQDVAKTMGKDVGNLARRCRTRWQYRGQAKRFLCNGRNQWFVHPAVIEELVRERRAEVDVMIRPPDA